jgi:hypothetical protein
MKRVTWHISNPEGQRWSEYRETWDFWIFGARYETREEAESVAMLLVSRNPGYVGKITVGSG